MADMIDENDEIEKNPLIEAQWDQWVSENNPADFPKVNQDELKAAILSDLTTAAAMTVEEYTLYQKWQEIHYRYPVIETNTLFEGEVLQMEDQQQWQFINRIKDNIWFPETLESYAALKPVMIYTKESEQSELWNCIRTFTSTMKNNSNIGRNLNYIVQDDVTKKYLGVICISSDFLDLTPRDEFIGWDRVKKTQGRMINYTAIGSTIVPLQPLGYNYVGGKLLALLCLSDEVQNQWKKQYGDVLAGVTTTSLYGKNKPGGLSQYDGLSHWKRMGFTSGSVSYETTRPTTEMLRDWLKVNHTRKYFEWYVAKNPAGQPYKRDHKNRSNTFAYNKLEIPKELIKSEHHRGIYFSSLYTNTKEFLKGEITEDKLIKGFDTSYDALVKIWKDKYASKRIKSLIGSGRVSSEKLFYDDLAFMSWEETKAKYLGDVGR